MKPSMLLAGAAMMAASAAAALPPLEQNPILRRELFGAAVGYEIFLNCPTIGGRWLRAVGRARELEHMFKSMGYTHEQIVAMIESDRNLKELVRVRDAYLARKGVRKGDTDAYCRLGREEIARNTFTGWLLKAYKQPVPKIIPDLLD